MHVVNVIFSKPSEMGPKRFWLPTSSTQFWVIRARGLLDILLHIRPRVTREGVTHVEKEKKGKKKMETFHKSLPSKELLPHF